MKRTMRRNSTIQSLMRLLSNLRTMPPQPERRHLLCWIRGKLTVSWWSSLKWMHSSQLFRLNRKIWFETKNISIFCVAYSMIPGCASAVIKTLPGERPNIDPDTFVMGESGLNTKWFGMMVTISSCSTLNVTFTSLSISPLLNKSIISIWA